MKLGIDVFLESYVKEFKDKKIGLITNMTGVNKNLKSTIDLLYNHNDLNLTTLYSPEHGIRGDIKEGEQVESSTDELTKLPVYSLYGDTRKPTEKMLANVDVLIFDIQDIGSRYYTYIYTLAYLMEASKEFNKELIVLDRPNPISGNITEGNLVEEKFKSFVSMYPIPNRHGLTVGEISLLYKNEFNLDCKLTVIPMEGWKRDMYYDDTDFVWIPPSPNTTSIDMSILYVGTCLIEGTNLSEGRGTAYPFEIIGAPFIDGFELSQEFNKMSLPGVVSRPTSFKPTYQKYKDEYCSGIHLHITDRKTVSPLKSIVYLLELVQEFYPDKFKFSSIADGNRKFFDLLAGTDELRIQIVNGNMDSYFEKSQKELEGFKKISSNYYLYK